MLPVIAAGLVLSVAAIKPLNLLLLGASAAELHALLRARPELRACLAPEGLDWEARLLELGAFDAPLSQVAARLPGWPSRRLGRLLLAHGGLTTLGANGMSMAVVGPLVGYLIWVAASKINLRKDVSVFLCAFFADLVTYAVTSMQLGIAFPDPHAGIMASVLKFMSIFCITQIPIAIAEGLLTVLVYEQLTKRQLLVVRGH